MCPFSEIPKHLTGMKCSPPLPPWSHHALNRLTDHYSPLAPSLSPPPPSFIHSCHPEQRWDDGSIPKRPDESSRRHSRQYGRMSRPSRGQPFRTTTTAGICDIFDAAHRGERFWEKTGWGTGVEAERNGTFPPLWCPISLVSTFCLAKKPLSLCLSPLGFLFFLFIFLKSCFATFLTHFLCGERLHFKEELGAW